VAFELDHAAIDAPGQHAAILLPDPAGGRDHILHACGERHRRLGNRVGRAEQKVLSNDCTTGGSRSGLHKSTPGHLGHDALLHTSADAWWSPDDVRRLTIKYHRSKDPL
jgi:hypothetical protein